MRLSLSLDDDLYRAAKALAQASDISLARAVNDLIRRALEPPAAPRGRVARSGFPVSAGSVRITSDDVRRLDDEDDRRAWRSRRTTS